MIEGLGQNRRKERDGLRARKTVTMKGRKTNVSPGVKQTGEDGREDEDRRTLTDVNRR